MPATNPNHNVRHLTDSFPGQGERIVEIPLSAIRSSPYQTRGGVDQDYLDGLAASIADNNLSTPVIVRPIGDQGGYELVCGENRCDAFRLLKRENIPAIIRNMNDCEAAILLAADNLQRRDLTDWEICQTINMLRTNGFAKTDQEVSRIIGRSRPYITKTKAFNELPDSASKIVATAPQLFGSSLAAELKSSTFNKKHPDLVAQALQRVVDGALKQAGVISWLRSKTSPNTASALKDSTFTLSNNQRVRITVYKDAIRIACKGMDSLELEGKIQKAFENSQ